MKTYFLPMRASVKLFRLPLMALFVWMGHSATAQFGGGAGTTSDPYQIKTPVHLDSIREFSAGENYLDDHFVLMNDLDFTGYAYADGDRGWQPIAPDTDSDAFGHNGTDFTGSFNGRGYVIRGLSIDREEEDYIGLFGAITESAVIDSLGVELVEITGDENVGALAGHSHGLITRSYARGGTVSGEDNVGGLVGYNSTGVIEHSHAWIGVTGTGSITTDCGGLVGRNQDTVRHSYATGSVTIGNGNAGGLVGYNNSGVIEYSYSTGAITGSINTNGLIGFNDGGTVTSSYWNTETSGQDGGAGTGLTTTQMYMEASFAGFDFTSNTGIWLSPVDGDYFPLLRGVGGQQWVSIAADAASVSEKDDARFTLTRTGAPFRALRVTVMVSETGTVIDGSAPASASFFDGSATTAGLLVKTMDDEVDEENGSITATIEEGAGYNIVDNAKEAVVSVTDDDLPKVSIVADALSITEGATASFTLTREGITTAALSVDVSVTQDGEFISGTAEMSATFAATSATATFTVLTDNDEMDEASGSITVTIEDGTLYDLGGPSSASVSVEDNDGDVDPEITISAVSNSITEGADAEFTLTRTMATGALTVNVEVTQQGDYTDDTPPTTVTFSDGVATAMLAIATDDDETDESNGTVTVKVVSGRGYILGDPSSASVSVTDNDGEANPEITISAVSNSITEGADAEFTLTRTMATGALTVNVEVTQQGEYIDGTPPTTVTFSDGVATATLAVATDDDETDEPDGTISVEVKVASGSRYGLGDPSSAEVSVTDNDEKMTVGLSDELEVALYPNPVNEHLHVRLPKGGQMSVYTLSGRHEKTYRIKPGKTPVSLDLSEWPAGIYMVKLIDLGGQFMHYRVVKR